MDTPLSVAMAKLELRLKLQQWQFKFFDVSQVKLSGDESAFLSEV